LLDHAIQGVESHLISQVAQPTPAPFVSGN
jgi:hypothetical protein